METTARSEHHQHQYHQSKDQTQQGDKDRKKTQPARTKLEPSLKWKNLSLDDEQRSYAIAFFFSFLITIGWDWHRNKSGSCGGGVDVGFCFTHKPRPWHYRVLQGLISGLNSSCCPYLSGCDAKIIFALSFPRPINYITNDKCFCNSSSSCVLN